MVETRAHDAVTTEQVWRRLARATFAVVSEVTATGAPRSSGVLYSVAGRRLYVVVGTDSWKARHLRANGRVAVTVPVRRGGLLASLAPIPPATISFHGMATVRAGGQVPARLASLVPPERREECALVEIVPEGEFLLYGIGVSLLGMRTPDTARGRVPVGE
ncbi:pyridoxamine 5'-phosphate oxidase family protein [Actinophytocola sp.]|uniref:pyridoxamine 5'-phosphate oxidase family protein n=1 Tax=Actinophytocola sp. TaxID=1872138 RepID=UPI002D25070E|nr:pyridoxamine 5'-phosphate oxidase family protein [Actinophytocola sp.]HYQ63963.1 pyridoxamine 5'-phosphate oxidase family protein [Actinophytocola sp.]